VGVRTSRGLRKAQTSKKIAHDKRFVHVAQKILKAFVNLLLCYTCCLAEHVLALLVLEC
jgi:hypothetical protein